MDYDQNPMRIFTEYTYREVKAFFNFFFYTFIVLGWILIMITAVLLIGICFKHPDISTIYASICSFYVILFFARYCNLFYGKKFYNARPFEGGRHYTFANDSFTVEHRRLGITGKSEIEYTALQVAWETEEMFYLRIEKQQVFLVSKQGFETGTPDELRTLLQSHLPQGKYHVKKWRAGAEAKTIR